tara:strand:- start:104 stop:400 length:297 start_codon:yes stop_codon:yes gene_type:complete
MPKNIVSHWLGINIYYDELEIKKTLNGSDFKDLFKFIANGERNKSRKIDTSKDISESQFKEIKNIIDETIEESIFDGAFQEMEDEIIDTLINMREDDD